MALFEVCEVIRLCNHDVGIRKGAEFVRDELMRLTKAEHNLLPHELTGKVKTNLEKKDQSPILPRFDSL